ncbi:MAG: DEAD/DEAH box helicase [Syntrophobacteraceae bacterium]|nr:DEAD/DEAH box helicase [Syntrophobacteraceae bacterium]
MKSLKEALSALTYQAAVQLLGPQGPQLLRRGGQHEIDIDLDVRLTDTLFAATWDDALVRLDLDPGGGGDLRFRCSKCREACEHVGAALALVLEEKTLLGLASPAPEEPSPEILSLEDLTRQALADREERARTERMQVQSMSPAEIWTDYAVTSLVSGKTYHVVLRGWERGDSYCSCPDFRKNTLGTCKHVMHTMAWARKEFSEDAQARPYEVRNIYVHLSYLEDVELKLAAPAGLPGEVHDILKPVVDSPITDPVDLMQRITRVERLGHDVFIYPDAEEHINRKFFLANIQRRISEIRKDPANHPLRKSLLKVELLPYQLDGLAFAAERGRAILADDMGLGKTIQGIGTAELLAREAGISRVLVVCPASLKSQWRIEIERFTHRSCQLIMGGAEARSTQYSDPEAFFTVCNYEQVLRDLDAIENVPWDLIILDEGQRIKNWESKTSRTIKGLRSPFALVLSGTPLENRLDELFSVVEFIDDRRLGPAFRFFNTYRVTDEKGKVLGYKNLDDLRARLKPILLRRTRREVMTELPPRTTEILRIPPTEEQLLLHNGQRRVIQGILKKRFLTEMDLLRLQKALLICRMAADSTFLVDKVEPAYSSKLAELEILLDQLTAEEDRKIILFSEWTTMLNLIEPLLHRRGLDFARLDGSVPQKKRQQLMHRFQTEPDCKLFITTNAGSTGLNLQAANTVINVDLPWNPAILEQRIARAHRMGQKRPVQVYLLVTEDTLEESLLVTLSAKQELALAALDPDSDVTQVDLASGIEELKRRLERLLGPGPEAAIDESRKARVEREAAEAAARRDRVASAGGQLLSAAFTFMGEMFAQREISPESEEMARTLKDRLAQCLERGPDGSLRMTVSLPDESALDNLAKSLAQIIQGA